MRHLKLSDSAATFHDAVDHVWGALDFDGDKELKAIIAPARQQWHQATSARVSGLRAEREHAGGQARALHKLGKSMGSFSKVEEGHMATDEGAKWTRLLPQPSVILRASQAMRKLKLDEVVQFVSTAPLPEILKAPATKLKTLWAKVTAVEVALDNARKASAKHVDEVNEAKQAVIDAFARLEGELMKRHGSDRAEIESYFLDLSPSAEDKKAAAQPAAPAAPTAAPSPAANAAAPANSSGPPTP